MQGYRHYRALVALATLSLAISASSSCSSPPQTYWTNFEYETGPDGSLIPIGDSTRLPVIRGYDAILKYDSVYWFVRNVDDRRMAGYRPDTGEEGMLFGNLVHNATEYFLLGHEWDNESSRWKVTLSKVKDTRPKILGDCVGYDEAHVLVVERGVRSVYGYDLEPLRVETAIECSEYPPGSSGPHAPLAAQPRTTADRTRVNPPHYLTTEAACSG